ncbi:hypothetical protein OUZ56_010447 [Daphnia magna]|uniref:Uncharacterized protein n=1 Tax=Daphnia magna TaxID=35525 RepID=A0ABR0AIK3_9CRUS|nr:hypothetical protein OUZ56_010447 [Daphnia magna]
MTPDTNTAEATVGPAARKTSDVGIAGGPSDQEETGSRVDEEYAVLTLVCVVAQIVQANEMRGMFVATEGAMVYPEATLALGESEWVVIYDVPTKRAEQTKDLESVHSVLESFDKKGLEVVHLLQEQSTLLNVTMGHLAERESENSGLMAAAGQMR